MKRLFGLIGTLLIITGLVGITSTDHASASKYILIVGFIISIITFTYYMLTLDKNMSGMSIKYSLNTLIYSIIIIFIISMFNDINLKHTIHIDMTQNQRFTLSDQTIKILKSRIIIRYALISAAIHSL